MSYYALPPGMIETPSIISDNIKGILSSDRKSWSHDITGLSKVHEQNIYGRNIKIGIVDTGCDISHPDLKQNIVNYKDFTNSSLGAIDARGHGTHVAGIIASRLDDSGYLGVAPEAKLYIAKGLSDQGTTVGDSLGNALLWLTEQKVDIINLSLGSWGLPLDVSQGVFKATQAGIIVVAAAGNSGPGDYTVAYPAKLSDVLCVSATIVDNTIAWYSSRGPEVDLGAPGSSIPSTYKDGKYAVMSGTSMASPFVAGVIALMFEKFDKLGLKRPNVNEIRSYFEKSCIDMGKKGRDNEYGYGVIKVDSLLNLISSAPTDTFTLPIPANKKKIIISFE